MADKYFFDTVRPMFRGLKQHQVDGMNKIVDYAEEWGYSAPQTAFLLANIKKETANWMQPIREGARKYGPNYSDRNAKRAVTDIYNRGIIHTNYGLPTGPYKQSYYGRGLIQITWYDNYKKFADLLKVPFDKEPDLALDWQHSLDIAFLGCRDGMFTGKAMNHFDLTDRNSVYKARSIVNGDRNKKYGNAKLSIGQEIRNWHFVFLKALG